MIHFHHDIRRQNSSEGSFILIKGERIWRSRVNIKDGVLALFSETECIIPSVIDIKNYHATSVQHPLYQIEGYRLIGKELIFDIYGENQEFFSKLRKYVIQQDFSEKYKILRKIRNEDDAEICRLKHKTSQQKFIGKCFYKLNLSYNQRRAINLEISILQKINHNSLIKFIEMFETTEQIILVFNIYDGDILQECTLTESEVQPLMKQLLRAIVHMHENNIIHRDLKLANILIYCSHPIISNFSLAEFYNEQNDYLYVRCGTPGYVAPEILQRQKYDHKVDVYSIGMILYNLLKKDKNIEVSLYNLEISPLCLDFLRKVLEVNPTKRLSSYEALHHPFVWQLKLAFKMNYQLPLINSHSPPKHKDMKFTFKTERVINIEGEGRSRINSYEPLDSKFRQKFSQKQLIKDQNIYY